MSNNSAFNNLDPIAHLKEDEELLIQTAKQQVKTILDSYRDRFDVFSELIQNALDAVEAQAEKSKNEDDDTYQPKIWIDINIKDGTLSVTDNGIGMDEDLMKKFLVPHYTFGKTDNGKTRGNKGVGVAYLGFGFHGFKVQSKQDGESIGAFQLLSGRDWIEVPNHTQPKGNGIADFCDVLENEHQGTTVEVCTGANSNPKNFSWINIKKAEHWFDVLRFKTPLGIVETTDNKIDVKLTVISAQGRADTYESNNPQYNWLHESDAVKSSKVQALDDVLKERERVGVNHGADDVLKHCKASFKKLDAMYAIWDHKHILTWDEFSKGDVFKLEMGEDETKRLIKEHEVCLYFTFFNSANVFTAINKKYNVRTGQKIIAPGYQTSTDRMIQGDIKEIALKKDIGYAQMMHCLVHFKDVHSNLGRKDFDTQTSQIAESLAKRAATIFIRHRKHLNLKGPGGKITDIKKSAYLNKTVKHYKENPIEIDNIELPLLSEPNQEQDVVTLFCQLLALKKLNAIKILATSGHDIYDGVFYNAVDNEDFIYSEEDQPLGINQERAEAIIDFIKDGSYETLPLEILEYKFELSDIITDIKTQTKDLQDIDLLISWTINHNTFVNGGYSIESMLDPENSEERRYFGTTHKLRCSMTAPDGIEIICLKDLVEILNGKIGDVKERHEADYSD